jgi:hypothetical protein
LKEKLIEEIVIVSAVIIVFLFHLPSALVVIITLPIAILSSFIAMHFLNLTTNIMSGALPLRRRHGRRCDHHGGERPKAGSGGGGTR